MDRLTYQRVADADDVDDAIVVRIWDLDGHLVGEADHPVLHHSGTGQIVAPALGNPVSVEFALANAQQMRDELPFDIICVQIADARLWQHAWGTLLPIKPSALIAKPFR